MNKKENSQTAYQYNSSSSAAVEEVKDHGWADPINRMIDQRYAFLDHEYESNGYLFRGMSSGLFDALLDNEFWHYASDDRGGNFEKELDVLLLSQDFSDAFTVSKLWEQKQDACIIVFKSEVFNSALSDKKAAMMATAEPGVVFKYPFLTEPLAIEGIEYLIVSSNLLDVVDNRNKTSEFCELNDSKFGKLTKLISDLPFLDKLIVPEQSEENYHRSTLEKILMECLLKREVTGAKPINSSIKPTRKV